jgi:ribosome silencing factor RsfS/YbeB/iojap
MQKGTYTSDNALKCKLITTSLNCMHHKHLSLFPPLLQRYSQPQRVAAAAYAQAPGTKKASYSEDDENGGATTSCSVDNANDDAQSRTFATACAKVAWEVKGENIQLLHVAPLVSWTSYLLIVTVFSRPQLNAILARISKEAEDVHGRTVAYGQNVGSTAWEVLDYGDVVINVLTADQRDYYDLEGFYGAAEEVDLPFVSDEQQGAVWQKKL